MDIKKYLEILHIFEKLKNNTRHSYTSSGRKESVAEHSHRLAVMAYFVKDEFPNVNIDRVILMCLFHDIGESFTGDIPCFEKTPQDEEIENEKIKKFLRELPNPYRNELTGLFSEMETLQTCESKLYKSLDKIEAVIQHNEADISTWLPLEYELQLSHGEKECSFSTFTRLLKEECNRITREKIKNQ